MLGIFESERYRQAGGTVNRLSGSVDACL